MLIIQSASGLLNKKSSPKFGKLSIFSVTKSKVFELLSC